MRFAPSAPVTLALVAATFVNMTRCASAATCFYNRARISCCFLTQCTFPCPQHIFDYLIVEAFEAILNCFIAFLAHGKFADQLGRVNKCKCFRAEVLFLQLPFFFRKYVRYLLAADGIAKFEDSCIIWCLFRETEIRKPFSAVVFYEKTLKFPGRTDLQSKLSPVINYDHHRGWTRVVIQGNIHSDSAGWTRNPTVSFSKATAQSFRTPFPNCRRCFCFSYNTPQSLCRPHLRPDVWTLSAFQKCPNPPSRICLP